MGLNGGLLHRWGYNYHGMAGRPLHSSYECVSLCHMYALYDTLRATGRKRAQQVSSIVNYIKPHSLHAGLFANNCADIGSEHDNVLFHTEAWWLSRGRVGKIFLIERGTFAIHIGCKKKPDLVDVLCNRK
jgi:hypothetical protein